MSPSARLGTAVVAAPPVPARARVRARTGSRTRAPTTWLASRLAALAGTLLAALLGSLLAVTAVRAQAVAGGPASTAAAGSGAAQTVHVERMQWVVAWTDAPPADDAGWRTQQLPILWQKEDDVTLARVWFRATFPAPPAGAEPLGVYLPRMGNGGTVWVNGQLIGDVQTMDDAWQVRWFRPFLFPVRADIVRDGDNELVIRQQTRDQANGMREVLVGPMQDLRVRYDWLYFWQHTMAMLAAGFCAVVGTFMLALWSKRRDERLSGLFGLACVLWAVRSLTFVIEAVPLQVWFAWRATYYVTTGGFIALMAIGLVRFAGRSPRWLVPVALGYWASGVAAFLILGWAARPWLDRVWQLGFVPLMLYAIWHLADAWRRERDGPHALLLVAIVAAVGIALHDYTISLGSQGIAQRQFFGLHLAAPVVLAALGAHLLDRFVRSLSQTEQLARTLEQKVADRERTLAENYERIGLLQREHALAGERQRIMQDLHDGVGSQLLSALAMVERGVAEPHEVSAMLRECLDDMRLAIDTLTPETADLIGALGNLRYRLSPRLEALGLACRWDVAALPDHLPVNPHDTLQLLRVVQEALANVIKHARATEVTVSARVEPAGLVLAICDNGRGFDSRSASAGRGLQNMRRRAQAARASLSLTSAPGGTDVRLVRPFEPGAL